MNTTMNRRELIHRSTLTLVGTRLAYLAGASGIALESAGCNLWNDILNWVPVGEASLNSILAVLTSNGVPIAAPVSAIVTFIEAGFTALTAAIKEYQAVTPPPVGAEAKVQAAFTALVDNFQTFLASLNVPGSIFSVISGLAQIVLSTIAAFENELPPVVAGKRTTVMATSAKLGQQTIPVMAKHRTRRAFKKDWNGVLDAGTKLGATIPKSAYQHLSLLERL
jgi:hypothetical protein